ncbi:MAG: hypothetical protein ACYCU5_14330 [Actinomycetes bacterium]
MRVRVSVTDHAVERFKERFPGPRWSKVRISSLVGGILSMKGRPTLYPRDGGGWVLKLRERWIVLKFSETGEGWAVVTAFHPDHPDAEE